MKKLRLQCPPFPFLNLDKQAFCTWRRVVVTFFLVLLLATSATWAATITSVGTGNWSASAWPNTGRTGTISTSTSSTTITGVGTSFLTQISVGNIIKTTGNVVIGTVASITNNTTLVLTGNAASTNTGISFRFQGVGPADDAVIAAGHTVTVDVTSTCNSLTVGNGSTISVSATFILTVTNGLTFPNLAATTTTGAISGSGTINVGSMAIGNSTALTGAPATNTVTVTSTISALNVAAALTLTSLRDATPRISNPVFQLQSGTVTVTGTLACVTAANAASTTLVTLATGAQTGTLNLANATATSTSGNAGISTFTFNGSGATVNYSNAAGQTIVPTTYQNLTLSGGGNKVFGAAVTTSANLTISGTAIANLGTFTHTANTLTLGGIGQVSGSHGSSGSTATTKNDTYFLSSSTGRVNVTVCSAPSTGTATTYYSRNATLGGNWNDNTSWTTSADGTGGPLASGVWPRTYDNVVIRSGHTITVDAINDNGSCGRSPDGLAQANIGSFISSNLAMFYQTGDITINGSFVVTGVELMLGGYTHLVAGGSFSPTSFLVNTGYLEVDAGTTLTGFNSLVLTGNSVTIINTSSSFVDDLIIDHTDATLCGTGSAQLQNGSGSVITYANSGSVSQICTSFTVTCSGGGCSGFPVTGTTITISGNSGPGGVGNSTYNKLWLRADNISQSNNTSVTSWADGSGNALTATNAVGGGSQPTFLTNSVNSILPSISFDGGDWLTLGTPASLNLIPQTDNWSTFFAFNVNNGSSGTIFSKATSTAGTRQYQYTIDSSNPNRFAAFLGGSFTNSGAAATGAWTVGTGLVSASATGYNTFLNETADLSSAAVGTGTVTTTDVLVGARRVDASTTTSGFNLTGNIGEVIVYNTLVNTAQRIIIDNYLSAKYATTLGANDVYLMDNSGNGNYDFEVAGIGQAADGTKQIDSKGTGMVRMWNANNLGNGEFLMWGRDNSSATSGTSSVGTSVDGTVIKERLTRIWRVSETGGDVGTVSISFDYSSLLATGSPLGSNLRLLIDRDGDGFADNDVTPVAGSSSGNIVVFSGVNFQDGDRFTLGNTSLSTPLPIELLTFNATVQHQYVLLDWSTATEHNNDFFTIERSGDAEKFEKVSTVKGRGNSNSKVSYSFVDETPWSGISYYRLKQTDFDGKYAYSPIKKVVFSEDAKLNFKAYPNPTSDSKVNFELSGISPGESVPIKITNSVGSLAFETVAQADEKGHVKMLIDLSPVVAGMYIVHINSLSGAVHERIIVRK